MAGGVCADSTFGCVRASAKDDYYPFRSRRCRCQMRSSNQTRGSGQANYWPIPGVLTHGVL